MRFGPPALLAGLLAALLGLTALPATAAAGDTTPRVVSSPSASLLPSWARTYAASGSREIWLLPAYDSGEDRWNPDELLGQVNDELRWFSAMSHGRFAMSATKVLEPLHFDSAQGSSCDAAARLLAPAISQFYANAPDDVFLVALTRSSDCPYSAIGDTPGRSLILTGFSPASLASEHQLLHELGHNLGLPHSSGFSGALLSSTSTPGSLGTDVLEYASKVDVMGSTGGALRLSAASLAALGWGDGVEQVPSRAAGTYAITLPEVSAPGADAAIVDDPVSGRRYSVTYVDAPRLTATGIPPTGRGVYLHEVPLAGPLPGDYGRSSLSYLMPWEGNAQGGSMGIGAGPGTAWVSPTGALALRVISLGDEGARITITVDPRGSITDTVGPAWPLEPTLQSRQRSANATVVLPAAWDQSGVVSYRVTAAGATVLSVRPPVDLVTPGAASLALTGRRALIRVTAIDGAGNATTWIRYLSTRAR